MKLCGKPAECAFVWPTMETLVVCTDHADKARSVAAALGSPLGQVATPVGATCTQRVRDDAP